MAISRVPGYALVSGLDRQGTDLSFISTTNSGPLGSTLVYMDFATFTVGINEANPANFGQSLVVNGNVLIEAGHLLTTGNLQYDLGNVTNQWLNVWAGNVISSNLTGTLQTANQPNITTVGNITNLVITGNLTVGGQSITNTTGNLNASNNRIIWVASPINSTDAANKAYVDSALSANTVGNVIPLGTPTDGNLTGANAAYQGFTTTTTVTDAIDILNSVAENLFTNTFVRSVNFTSNTTAGGAGQTILLTLVPQGNVNQYVIQWGDGTANTTTSSTTASHQYTTNAGTPFTVAVTANNTGGVGPSNTAGLTRTGYINIYSADPVINFGLYGASSGGSVVPGYTIQGNVIYLQNTTTNTNAATVTWSVLWGDSNFSNIANNTSAGGANTATRLGYTYPGNSGSGNLTVTLNLLTDNIANPAIIPLSSTQQIKVYANTIAVPANLSTKTISFSSTVGTNPYLAYGFIDNTGSTTLTAGAAVSARTVATGATAVTSTVTATGYAYSGNIGNLYAVVNGTGTGNINLAATTTTTTVGNTVLSALSDYNLLSSTGSAVTFPSSTYYPGLYYGYTAQITRTGGSIPVGVNRYALAHTAGGNTNNIDFVKDDVTTVPTVTQGTISIRTPGTYRYISGIPYFNTTGSPTLWWNGPTISSFIGQTYNNTANVVFVATGTKLEGSTSDVITPTAYTYTSISNSSASMLNGSTPIAGTGNVSAYALANISVPITASAVRSIANILIGATNVNGTSAGTENNTTRIAVHTAAQSGISEIAITANASLGDGTYTSSGVRSFYFNAATTSTPTYVNSTNFYTTSIYSESGDPGVAGTKEATIRMGVLGYNVNNYSTGYLPPGPNRSADTGTQYFTFAFQRKVVANFSINIVAPSGVVGVWIAAPGTTLDNTSGLNGWLDCSTQYAGSGKPGSNTGAGGNGSNGCAVTGADKILSNTALNGTFKQTLGTENLTNATNNVALIRIALVSGQTVTTLGIV